MVLGWHYSSYTECLLRLPRTELGIKQRWADLLPQIETMDPRMYIRWILPFLLLYESIKADIGDVHISIQYQIWQCFTNTSSKTVQSGLAQQLLCLKSSLYRCLLFQELHRRHHTEIRMFCGIINTGLHIRPYWWDVTVPPKFNS